MMKRHRLYLFFIGILLCQTLLFPISSFSTDLPKNFVNVKEVIPDVVLDIRYFTSHNFIGRPIDGYLAPKCFVTK